ncbi:MAG: bifunctional UDP-N-acetylglucosamine diphosphorylase/glucosamine-1-phosphate N-acetyltransferase GlmU [Acetobacteraceae bacterium]|nr:bifunctional UDP-N-acetylglucosamine diphosphorylase/glucosamine-1-phosphate N-acetyltransferase GlmU [Acetobacteraceae bacterium]
MSQPATAIILAAGLGTRMKSALPKAAHPIAGRPMLAHLIAACQGVFDRIVVVIGPDIPVLAAIAAPHPVVVQAERRGTAHAALQAVAHFGAGNVAVLYADNPLVRPETLRALLTRHRAGDAGLVLLAMRPPNPGRYGRVIARNGVVEKIVEYADASEDERSADLCNAGVLCGAAPDMAAWLRAVRNDNARGEYYLTDLVALANATGKRVVAMEAPYEELRGINSRAELAEAEAVVQHRLRAAAMAAGVSLTDPASVFLSADTEIAPDVIVEPHVIFGPGVRVATGARILAFSHLEGCIVGEGAIVGPFARLRPGAVLERDVHVGNFVEVKEAILGEGVKASHLSYLGDTTIGARTNIGAGTITCNYDGENKHRTTIGADVFIGSDTALVAPVSVGDGAIVGAGSVITRDVAPDSLVIARGQQVEKPGRARAIRAARKQQEKT